MREPRGLGLRLSQPLLWGLVGVCLLPGALRLFGVDVGVRPVTVSTPFAEPELYELLRGAFLHTLLEGAAVAVALTTGVLAVLYYRVAGSVVAPILALSLFFAGILDGLHVLASDYLIVGRATNQDFTPFSWAIARLFNATILVLGIVTLVLSNRWSRHRPQRVIVYWIAALTVFALAVSLWVVNTTTLPSTMQSSGLIARPWDVAPLALYVIAAGIALPPLLRVERGPFVQAVWLSMLPAIATQAYMAFGSTLLFDHFFNSAHILKIVSYAIPLVGLLLEYQRARSGELTATADRARAEVRRVETERRVAELETVMAELERSNRELEQFAYVASHDLRAPLRAVSNLTTWLAEDVGDELSEQGREYVDLIANRIDRLESLITSLLRYSKVGRADGGAEPIDSGAVVSEIVDLIDLSDTLEVVVDPDLPVVTALRTELHQVFLNLLTNAARYAESRIEVSCDESGAGWVFTVEDDGPGIEPRYQERIWGLFTRLEARDDVEGAGLGLALIKKIVEAWNGRVWLDSEPGEGAAFHFSVPGSVPSHVPGVPLPVAVGSRPTAPRPLDRADRDEIARLVTEGRTAIEAFDPDWLSETLERAVVSAPAGQVVEEILAPLVDAVGELWFHQKIGVRHEHMASAAIRGTLERLIAGLSHGGGGRPHLLAATPSGQRHELGLLLGIAQAALSGWRVTYLGSDLPLPEIAGAVEALEADALALSLVYPERDPELDRALEELGERLPPEFPVLVGGAAAGGYARPLETTGATVLRDLSEARVKFEELAALLRPASYSRPERAESEMV